MADQENSDLNIYLLNTKAEEALLIILCQEKEEAEGMVGWKSYNGQKTLTGYLGLQRVCVCVCASVSWPGRMAYGEAGREGGQNEPRLIMAVWPAPSLSE